MSYDLREELRLIENAINKARIVKKRGKLFRLRKARDNKRREIAEAVRCGLGS